MPYSLKSVCEICGREQEIPMRTVSEVYTVSKVLLARTIAMAATGCKGEAEVKPLCPECDKKPVVEGTKRVGSKTDADGDVEVLIQSGTAKPV